VGDADTVEHVFTLDNQGDEVLLFGRLRACCGATASLRDQQVSPGSNTLLNVKLSLRGRRGPLNKSIYLATNDPRQPHMMLRITGVVTGAVAVARQGAEGKPGQLSAVAAVSAARDIMIVPQHLTLTQTAAPAAPVTRYVALRSRSGTPFAIKGASLPGKATIKSQTPLGEAGWRIEITGLLPSEIRDGARIELFTDKASEPTVSIPIRVIPPQAQAPEPPSP